MPLATKTKCAACTVKIGEGYENTKAFPVGEHGLCPGCFAELKRNGWIEIAENNRRVTILFERGKTIVVPEMERNRISLEYMGNREQMVRSFKRLAMAGVR